VLGVSESNYSGMTFGTTTSNTVIDEQAEIICGHTNQLGLADESFIAIG
jgi:hypothetical protein